MTYAMYCPRYNVIPFLIMLKLVPMVLSCGKINTLIANAPFSSTASAPKRTPDSLKIAGDLTALSYELYSGQPTVTRYLRTSGKIGCSILRSIIP